LELVSLAQILDTGDQIPRCGESGPLEDWRGPTQQRVRLPESGHARTHTHTHTHTHGGLTVQGDPGLRLVVFVGHLPDVEGLGRRVGQQADHQDDGEGVRKTIRVELAVTVHTVHTVLTHSTHSTYLPILLLQVL